MNHPLLPLPERSKEKDEVYAVLGRALAYASEFENNCKNLAHFFEIEEAKNDFMHEVWQLIEKGKLNDKINRLVKLHKLPESTSDAIHKARDARNYIAHEVGLKHIYLTNTPESILYFETDILLEVQKIITGNQIVLDLTRALKESTRAHGSEMNSYSSAVCDWILR